MNKAEELKLQRLVEFIRNHKTSHKEAREIIQSYADEYAQQVKEKYAYQQAMAYEEWLCENGYTKTISARPDYLDFFNHQNQER